MQINDTVLILGIPIDNLTMEETLERIHAMAMAHRNDGKPRLVATVNVDFLVNTLSWFSQEPRHPELLSILQHADLVTADGMPLVWASRILGNPLKERVTGADLVPRLAATHQEKSFYFLGGNGEVGKRAADTLKKRFPDMTIAGVDAPFIHISGEALSNTDAEDSETVQRINDAHPDILLIAFGNPKQESWFHRNRFRLKAGVTIGIGGTFDFITGNVSRAPVWIQKIGGEWIYRLLQDPKRLGKRYLIGFFKFAVMILPLILHMRWRQFRASKTHPPSVRDSAHDPPSFPYASQHIIALPEALDAKVVRDLKPQQEEWLAHDQGMILDFTQVHFMDSSGLGFLLGLWKKKGTPKGRFHLVGVQPPILRLLSLNRVTSLLTDHMHPTLEDVVIQARTPSKSPPFFYTLEDEGQALRIQLSGTLDAAQIQEIDIPTLLGDIAGKDLIMDLTPLRFVDSTGLILLLKIKKASASASRLCIPYGAQQPIINMLRITRLDHLFPCLPDIHTARQAFKSKKQIT